MLIDFFFPQFDALPNANQCWFMQDGAPPHYTRGVRQLLTNKLGNRWIGREANRPIPWPPRSPDLTPCDYFLWGFIKGEVLPRQAKSLSELQQFVCEAFDKLKSNMNMLNDCFDLLVTRYTNCFNSQGAQVI